MSQSDEALAKPASSPAGGDVREAVAEYGMKALPEDVCLRMEREARNLANLWANGDEPVRHAALALQVRTHVTALSPSTSAAEPVAWIANCCHCGRVVDTRETTQGGDNFGCELNDGRWTCSPECWDAVVEPGAAHPVPAPVESAQGVKEAVEAEREACRYIANAMGYSPVSDGVTIKNETQAAFYMAAKIAKAIETRASLAIEGVRMGGHGWKGTKVRNADGRTGVISDEWAGFLHLGLKLCVDAGGEAIVQLNSNSKDSGETGWQWLCENFDGGPAWLPLGDHSGCEVEQVHPRPAKENEGHG